MDEMQYEEQPKIDELYKKYDIAEQRKQKHYYRSLIAFGVFIVFAIIILTNFRIAIVKGSSMEPTLHDGDYVVMTKCYWLFGDPQKNDIVVLDDNNEYIVKRIHHFAMTEDKKPGVYVLGDNRDHSEDSRSFGVISKDHILGKLIYSPEIGEIEE